jgi:hypothetical protein
MMLATLGESKNRTRTQQEAMQPHIQGMIHISTILVSASFQSNMLQVVLVFNTLGDVEYYKSY